MAPEASDPDHDRYDLLGKTELAFEPIELDGANLNDIAATVADVLGLGRDELWVVDVRGRVLTIDVLRQRVDACAIAGRQGDLLRRLGELPGVEITEDTAVTSAGMLGWIAHDEVEMKEALERSERMAADMLERIKRRVVVFSTGAEVASGQIEDTNAPAIAGCLGAEGYTVVGGGVLPDDRDAIVGRMRKAILDDGFGLVITTGGVGAEDKDCTVEAVLSLDPEAATLYITRYEVGTGRHVKDGVRIAVGQYAGSLIVSLPGPNDEVIASLGPLTEGLKSAAAGRDMADAIAHRLRARLH